ncbi:MAG: hypothetical protein ACXW5U_25195 [Thermoanaerobaculia bacterium]
MSSSQVGGTGGELSRTTSGAAGVNTPAVIHLARGRAVKTAGVLSD